MANAVSASSSSPSSSSTSSSAAAKPAQSSDLRSSLLTLLQCSVCYSVCLPGARQCANGHMTCARCLKRLGQAAPSCPVCRVSPVDTRNLLADRIVELILPEVECQHGCKQRFPLSADPDIHESRCPLRPFCCPDPFCAADFAHEGALWKHFSGQHSYAVGRAAAGVFTLRLESWTGGDFFRLRVLDLGGSAVLMATAFGGGVFSLWAWHFEQAASLVASTEDAAAVDKKDDVVGEIPYSVTFFCRGRQARHDLLTCSFRVSAGDAIADPRLATRLDGAKARSLEADGKLHYALSVR